MMETNYDVAAQIVAEQEEKLQFDSFSNEDAWKLGCLMVEEVKARGIDLSICIRKLNGSTIFQYATAGTTRNNEAWMNRKYNTVSHFEASSLRQTIDARKIGYGPADQGLTDTEYVFCGGGFPIKLKGSGLYMVLIVSGLPHEQDHGFIVDCLSKYLGVEVPTLDMII